MEEKATIVSVTKRRPSVFGRIWFILLLLVALFPTLSCVYRSILYQSLWISFHYGTIHRSISIIAYLLLTAIWGIIHKKAVFPGKWIALSFLPIIICSGCLNYFFGEPRTLLGAIVMLLLPAIITGVLWILYGQSLKKANVVGSLTYANSTVTMPMGENEQVLLERHFNSIAPFILFLAAIIGAIIGIDMLNWYYTRDTGTIFLLGSLLLVVIGVLILSFGKIHLYVTKKRVYVQAALGYRRSLPLNRISSVSTGLFNCLQITSAAGLVGQIQVFLLPRHLEVYDTINALLNEVE